MFILQNLEKQLNMLAQKFFSTGQNQNEWVSDPSAVPHLSHREESGLNIWLSLVLE